MEVHPAANIYPAMTPEEYEALKNDIALNGLLQPILLMRGAILDGRHRMQAIEELQQNGTRIEARFDEYTGNAPVSTVHSLNFHRRHLTVTQKACIGNEFKKELQKEIRPGGDRRSEEFQGGNISTLNGAAREQAAALVGVSDRVIDKVAHIEQEAPALYDAMKDGGISVWDAEREVNGEPPRNGTVERRLDAVMSSASYEWYTPAPLIARVRRVLGSIDLDPCTSLKANETVQAAEFYTSEDDGLKQTWTGRVFLNPPYGSTIGDWVKKLTEEHRSGAVSKAIALVPARTDTAWFRLLRPYPRCFLSGRIQFGGPGDIGNSATFPSVVVALGCDLQEFHAAFCEIGDVYEYFKGGQS